MVKRNTFKTIKMKYILITIILLESALITGLINEKREPDFKLNELQMRCVILSGYKKAYLNHVDKCDCHDNCIIRFKKK